MSNKFGIFRNLDSTRKKDSWGLGRVVGVVKFVVNHTVSPLMSLDRLTIEEAARNQAAANGSSGHQQALAHQFRRESHNDIYIIIIK
jgi:hypothetical protein